ncbi:MAG: right-handed parallel beta-helix repeat-containing protein [Planctomycetota bacterium]
MHRITGFITTLAASLTLAGPLTPPPGAVTPTGKTIQQAEPRTPLSQATTPGNLDYIYVISEPGSYYLAEELQGVNRLGGILISSNDVTLDLNGFTVRGPALGGKGIFIADFLQNVSVRNGTVRGWGSDGIDARDTRDCRFEDLTLLDNGGDGLHTGSNAIVQRCVARDNGGFGFELIERSRALDSIAHNNGDDGFRMQQSSAAERCTASANAGDGFNASSFSRVIDCSADDNQDNGIRAGGSIVERCIVWGSGLSGNTTTAGILASGSSTIRGNRLSSNGIGIETTGPNNLIVGNSLTEPNTAFVSNSFPNAVGPFISRSAVTTNTNPNANIEF